MHMLTGVHCMALHGAARSLGLVRGALGMCFDSVALPGAQHVTAAASFGMCGFGAGESEVGIVV